jgi:poly-gamma-glutamate synthesis protein (capsule biosynthesis protein)
MGVDIVSIANNHVYDYGDDAFLDMLSHLKEYDMPYVGGGINRDEATKPYYFIANGYKIAFIGATRAEKYILTPEATENSSGVFRAYDPTLLLETISEVKKTSDFVIVLIHWGREDSHKLEDVQVETGKKYIDAGADLLIGTHAHVLQGMEFYNNKLIAHNLGDFIFNRETKDTGILSVTINNDGNMSYEFVPCYQNKFKTTLLNGSDKLRVINNMRSYSINTIFDDSGRFYVAK